MNGPPLPPGYKFGTPKEGQQPEQPPAVPTSDRREKTRSRAFKNWGFGKSHGKHYIPAQPKSY